MESLVSFTAKEETLLYVKKVDFKSAVGMEGLCVDISHLEEVGLPHAFRAVTDSTVESARATGV